MSNLSNFEKLDCWIRARKLATQIYQISNKGNLRRDFGLRDQLRRSAVSIASNIAEGKERETIKEFIRFLYIAKGSAGELKTQLYIAYDTDLIDDKDFSRLLEMTSHISRMLGALIKSMR